MKKSYIVLIGVFITILLFANCNSNGNKEQTIRFPNKDSELTLVMREMYDYYDQLKKDLEAGKATESFRNFEAIHTASSTQPEKAKSDLYKAMAKAFEASVQSLHNSKTDVPMAFNVMIDNCMNCHQQMCPGPMVKIKKLYIKDKMGE